MLSGFGFSSLTNCTRTEDVREQMLRSSFGAAAKHSGAYGRRSLARSPKPGSKNQGTGAQAGRFQTICLSPSGSLPDICAKYALDFDVHSVYFSQNPMYGMVNKAVEDMVVMHHGEGMWEQIKAKAGVDVEVFMSNEGYPDEITYNLVAAASEMLKASAEQILHGFGEHWVMHTAQEGYGGLMQAAGKTLPEFLRNLPNFHSRVAMIFPKLQPPRFQCADITDRSLNLHYMSHREGLAPFVVGLMHGLGKMFNTPVTVRQTAARAQGADHDVFEVTWTPASAS